MENCLFGIENCLLGIENCLFVIRITICRFILAEIFEQNFFNNPISLKNIAVQATTNHINYTNYFLS